MSREKTNTTMRKAKIVCTIGPASDRPELLDQLIQSGMDAARLNFSHGTHESHGRAIKAIREAADRRGVAVAIIQDLQGPRIRVGEVTEGGLTLIAGSACAPADDLIEVRRTARRQDSRKSGRHG